LQFGVAIAWLTLFDVLLLVILIPVMDKIIYPWIRAKQWNFTMVTRILIGFLFAISAMIAAGVVEMMRRRAYWDTEKPTCCYHMVPQQLSKIFYWEI